MSESNTVRVPVSITAVFSDRGAHSARDVFVVCDDGTVWIDAGDGWVRFPITAEEDATIPGTRAALQAEQEAGNG